MPDKSMNLLLAHHNCHMLKDSSLPLRPVMLLTGKDYTANRYFYRCPACGMEIMLQVTVKEG